MRPKLILVLLALCSSGSARQQRHLSRCRRAAARHHPQRQFYRPYQRVPAYTGELVLPPRYVPPTYLEPYYPTRCGTYCVPCPTSSCRRRCHSGTTVVPTRIATTVAPSRSTTVSDRFKGAVPHYARARMRVFESDTCDCDPIGSKFLMCNVTTGDCVCKPHFVGTKCDTCEDHFWKNNGRCVQCACDPHGTADSAPCDKSTGVCACANGVGGDKCDACAPEHYGDVRAGCKRCDPCDLEGHVCDERDGKCVCPTLTIGQKCDQCAEDAWGFEPGIGCKSCGCSPDGSATKGCAASDGTCACLEGFQGRKCDVCAAGHHGYPSCAPCGCAVEGTLDEDCATLGNSCRCGDEGTCRCKENVRGLKCDACAADSYGLSEEKQEGCTRCFCFGRSTRCKGARIRWEKVRLEKTFEDDNSVDEVDDILMLPQRFLGDLTASYGGYLGVVVPGGGFRVFLKGNGVQIRRGGVNEVRLLETGWDVDVSGAAFPGGCRDRLDRACFMAILQRVEWIRIESQGRIAEVVLDKGKAHRDPVESPTVEECECEEGYSGSSCQDPAEGYYRWFPRESVEWVDVVVGVARRCECNGRSTRCDPETGKCKNCTENTIGDRCESCDVGYHRDEVGECRPCPCPSIERNNARSCARIGDGFVCNCKKGYHGNSCDKCQPGFYDSDPSATTACDPCDCNPHGTLRGQEAICDESGRCACAEGFRGDKCDRCADARSVIVDGACAPCDECSQMLFDELDGLERSIVDIYGMFKDGVAPPWRSLTDKLERYEILSDGFKGVKSKVDRLLGESDLEGLEAKAKHLGDVVEGYDAVAVENLSNIDALYDNSSFVASESDRLTKKLSKLIDELENFGKVDLSVDEALRRANEINSNINAISDLMRALGDADASAICLDVIERVDRVYRTNATALPNLHDFRTRLDDLIDETARADSAARLADRMNSANVAGMRSARSRATEAWRLANSTIDGVAEAVGRIEAIEDVATRLREVYDELRRLSGAAEFGELEERTKRQMEEEPEVEEVYLRAIEHVQELERRVEEYQSMFNFTKDEWRKINASGSYETIIAGINDARKDSSTAQRVLIDASRLVDPAHSDRLIDKTNLAHAYSDRLRQRINNFNDVSKDFNRVKNELVDLKYSILEDGKSNNDLTQVLHRIESEITSQSRRVQKIEEAIANGSVVSEEMAQLSKNVSELEFDKQHLFFKEYQNFLNLTTTEEINNLTNKLKHARRRLQELNVTGTDVDAVRTFNGLNVRSKIDELRNKIAYARQVADTVNVAMTLNDCLMTYRIRKPEFFKSISVTFKCKSDCEVFKWSKVGGATIRLYVEGGVARVEANGRGASLEARGVAEADAERTVTLQKSGSLLRVLLDSVEVKSERIGNAFVAFDPEDLLEAGGTPGATPGAGYVVKMALNDRNLGLWNFRSSEGRCRGQKRDRSDVPNSTLVTYYLGDGYSVYGTNLGSSALNPQQLSWTFDLSTFDEDALIYLAITEKCSQHIGLYLESGRARFSVRHDPAHSILQTPDPKLNDGRPYKLQVTLSYDKSARRQRYNLIVRSEDGVELANVADDLQLPRTQVFKVRQATRYLGGVPPTFSAGCVPFGVASLLGFLKPQAPLTNETASYGVVQVDKKLLEFPNARLLSVAGSHLQVAWRSCDVNTLSFVARPSAPSGLLFDFEDGSRVYLVERRVAVSVGGVEHLSSDVVVVDEYNEVQVKFGKQKSLSVNDKREEVDFVGKIKIEKGFVIGGAGYAGSVRDLVINHESVIFNYSTVKTFVDVQIGREATTTPPPSATTPTPGTRSLVPNLTNSMQNTERCAPAGSHSSDPGAVAYGDDAHSWTRLRTDAWRRDYRLGFEFRTFRPDGIILIASNQKLQNYILLDLVEGKLRLVVKGKKKKVPVTLTGSRLDDGRWHSVAVHRKKRKMVVVVDGERTKPVRVPKAAVRNEAYVGGIDPGSDYVKIEDLKDDLRQFRGCIREFKVNDEEKLHEKGTRHSNTGECFPDVEEGAYFNGEAYAVYRYDYRPGASFDVSFEFRTSEQNGVLLSLSGARSVRAVSLELRDGAVAMTVDLGAGPSSVANNLDSDFALCDDRWHNVTASYTDSELTVVVDGIRKSWVQAPGPGGDATEGGASGGGGAPLYVGGLPVDAPQGSLRARENFRGCLRKLKIENRPTDWSDMRELRDVSLDSCPSTGDKSAI